MSITGTTHPNLTLLQSFVLTSVWGIPQTDSQKRSRTPTGRRQHFSDGQISNARRLIDAGEAATHIARDLGMSRATLYRRIGELDARQWVTSQTS